MTGNRELAITMDPLTSAVCTLAEVREMTAELLGAQSRWLPQFADRKPATTSAISIPRDIKPVDVPLDPALAIANRFGELAAKQAGAAAAGRDR